MHYRIYLSVALASAILSSFASADADEIDFNRDIRPILSDNCFACHGPDAKTREADLRLDIETHIDRLGSNDVPIVDAGKPQSSELYLRIATPDSDSRMPPPETKRTLSKQQTELIRRWIESGAKWQSHWSFVALKRLQPPILEKRTATNGARINGARINNAIDQFVQKRLENEGKSPANEASKPKLIRRVTLALTGLPPTPDEIDRFLNDKSPNAYETVVDRLLATPRFGERMAWNWLDAARYADTNGFQGDNERTMWPWRDWVIQALNLDMPYDQFSVSQIAGDLIPDATEQQKLATGFCRNHMINGEGGRIPEENRVEYVFDQIETVGTVWLGLTIQCCRCHDHKFDQLTQREYFQFFDFFNQTPVSGGGGDPATPPNLTIANRKQKELLRQLGDQIELASKSVSDYERSVLPSYLKRSNGNASGKNLADMPDEIKKALEVESKKRNSDQLKKLESHFRKPTPEYADLLKQHREALDKETATTKLLPKVMVMGERDAPERRTTHLLNKGLYNQKQEITVQANTPAALPALEFSSSQERPISQAGKSNVAQVPNRLDLAKWLVDPANPLVARVTVNRMWQLFFDRGIVKSPDDFGVQGEKPTHPELLDWLACEFIESGWDQKHLARCIVCSATFRQTASVSKDAYNADPENRWLARGPRSRLPSWMIRDQALAVSGLLVSEIGGPSVKPYQPSGIWADATFGNKKYTADHGANLYRRSLYVFWRRIVGPTMFFDVAKRQTCSVVPGRTNTPLHALVTLNDTTYIEAARVMAERIAKEHPDSPAAQLNLAFRLATSRFPADVELQILQQRYDTLLQTYLNDSAAAQNLLSIGEAVSVTELPAEFHAALTGVCLLILNLDETLNN